MDRAMTCLALAKRELQASERMLEVTYRLLEEPRVLVVCAGKILSAMTNAAKALLMNDAEKKRIPRPHEDLDSLISAFRARQARRYRLSMDYASILEEIRHITESHRTSPVEFSRDGNLVICRKDYALTVVSHDAIAAYSKKAKVFINEVENMLQ